MKTKILLIICLSLVFIAGLVSGTAYYSINKKDSETKAERMKGYKYISPLFDYEISPELKNRVVITLKDQIKKIIDDKIEDNQAIYVSVYFRDMFNGPWFGINEQDGFAPASLLKVPVMIAYLKCAEQNPEILKTNLMYEKEIDDHISQNILPDKKLEPGKAYKVEDLIERMIKYSDNTAKTLLFAYIGEDTIDKIYTDMGLVVPGIRNKNDLITIKNYSTFFRVLFNASYLNREMSEKALEILSKTTFKLGIEAGVPKDVVVAHKFAERGDLVTNTMQVHDCGIVYYKDRPYLLCVMTYGRDFKTLSNIIKDISSVVYEKMESSYNDYK